MQITKKEVNNLLARLPDDCTLEDIQYHLYVLQKIERSESNLSTRYPGQSLSRAYGLRIVLPCQGRR